MDNTTKTVQNNIVKKKPVSKLMKFFKSKTFFAIAFGVFTVVAVILLLFIDPDNSLRQAIFGNKIVNYWDDVQQKWLPQTWSYYSNGVLKLGFLLEGDKNFFSNIFEWFGFTRIDIFWNSWLMYFIILFTGWFLVIASCLYGKFAPKFEALSSKHFKHKKTIRRVAKAYYYGLCIIIIALIIGVLAVLGVFNNYFTSDILKNLLFTLLLSAIFTLIPIIVLACLVVLFVFIFYFIGIAVAQISKSTYQKYDEYPHDGTGEGDSTMSITDDEGYNLGTPENPFNTLVESLDGGNGGELGANGSIKVEREEASVITDVTRLFPALSAIDQDEELRLKKIAIQKKKGTYVEQKAPFLKPEDFVVRFQAYLCIKHKLYYELPLLRSFLAGMAAARILILEGLSGTGKSMLPRMFGEFIGSKTFFCPVQATWRDRTDIVGYYSDFTNEFKETEFLKRLYKMNYHQDKFNLMVLDEMNISRIEYYFADFLSILEYPASDWLIKIMQVKEGQEFPKKLESGNVRIPKNTWFIGTANTDDSTFTITDKVYDRAIIIDFKEKNSPIQPIGTGEPLKGFTVDQLAMYFKIAYSKPENALNAQENERFVKLCDLAFELFDIRFGNRILNQINNFIPVYVLFGGTKDDAIDFMFARKVIRKLEGKFDDYIKDGLLKLQKEIHTLYGKAAFSETNKYIRTLLKKFY